MLHKKLITIALILATTIITGCTMQHISSSVVQPVESPVERLVIVIKSASFQGHGTASTLGNRNLHNLIPNLSSQLPEVFETNGLKTRSVVVEEKNKQLAEYAEANEAILVILPVSAFYSSQSGQQLKLQAMLLAPDKPKLVWKATIKLMTPGFGKFDAELANRVAVDLLGKLHSDKIIRLQGGEVQLPQQNESQS